MPKKILPEVVENYFKDRGVLLKSSYINNRTPLVFMCSKCGREYKILWEQIQKGVNPNLLCLDCMKKERYSSLSTAKIIENLEATGAKILNTGEINTHTIIDFICSTPGCDNVWKVTLGDYNRGRNKSLICPKCYKGKSIISNNIKHLVFSEEKLKVWEEEFRNKGAELLTTSFENEYSYLYFKCSRCGKEHRIQITNYVSGVNPYLLCDACMFGERSNPSFRRKNGDLSCQDLWHTQVANFFNIPTNQRRQKITSIHHINKRSIFPELALSITNGYPLDYNVHYGNFSFLHYGAGVSIVKWPQSFKNANFEYTDYRFLDLCSSVVTDIILFEEDSKDILKRKEKYALENILYIPLYYEELISPILSKISLSMIKSRLGRKFGNEVYKYTNTTFNTFSTRKLLIKNVSKEAEMKFLLENHIQGYVHSKIALGLYSGETLVSLMTFGTPRIAKYKGEGKYELLRFACLCNSSVPGAASRLFKYFILNYTPEFVISYCDVRFSSINPEETVYPKLGFKFDGKTSPNYKYTHPNTNKLYSRQAFQKWELNKKLNIFDENLSESENMRNNGYIKLYDCGNFRFIWQNNN